VPVPVAVLFIEIRLRPPLILNPVSVITTDVPSKAGKGLKDGVNLTSVPLILGVTSVWAPDATAPPMLNFAGVPVMVKLGKLIVIASIEATEMAEKVTISVWHDMPQPLLVTDFTANPDRSPDGTPVLTASTEVSIVTPASSPLVAAPNVNPVIVTF